MPSCRRAATLEAGRDDGHEQANDSRRVIRRVCLPFTGKCFSLMLDNHVIRWATGLLVQNSKHICRGISWDSNGCMLLNIHTERWNGVAGPAVMYNVMAHSIDSERMVQPSHCPKWSCHSRHDTAIGSSPRNRALHPQGAIDRHR